MIWLILTCSVLVQSLPLFCCCCLTGWKNMRCNHTVTYCLSQHSQEFMSPAIDLWHDAQDRGHGWLTSTSTLVKDVSLELYSKQIRIPSNLWHAGWRNTKYLWIASKSGTGKIDKQFWQTKEIILAMYKAKDGRQAMCKCLITLISNLFCDNPHIPTFNPCWTLTSMPCVMPHASVVIKAKGSQDRYEATSCPSCVPSSGCRKLHSWAWMLETYKSSVPGLHW